MTASPVGCGVLKHPEDCLCDVHIKQPTTVRLAIPHEMLHGEALAHYGKWDGTLAHWFELAAFAWPAIWNARSLPSVEENRARFGRGMPDDVHAYMLQRIREGGQPSPIRAEIIQRFGYTINKATVTNTRKRMAQRGQL